MLQIDWITLGLVLLAVAVAGATAYRLLRLKECPFKTHARDKNVIKIAEHCFHCKRIHFIEVEQLVLRGEVQVMAWDEITAKASYTHSQDFTQQH